MILVGDDDPSVQENRDNAQGTIYLNLNMLPFDPINFSDSPCPGGQLVLERIIMVVPRRETLRLYNANGHDLLWIF